MPRTHDEHEIGIDERRSLEHGRQVPLVDRIAGEAALLRSGGQPHPPVGLGVDRDGTPAHLRRTPGEVVRSAAA